MLTEKIGAMRLHHLNLHHAFHFWNCGARVYIVMEHLSGGTLRQRIRDAESAIEEALIAELG